MTPNSLIGKVGRATNYLPRKGEVVLKFTDGQTIQESLDNVIAVVRSACTGGTCGPLPGEGLIKPVTEAIHWNHRNIAEGGTIAQHDAFGRDGGCQGCHPAHRSDGDMSGYPITKQGDNFYAESDNRLANGGCFVGRDVHSNPLKDVDGAETPEHLNAVGQWLADNVFRGQDGKGVTAPDGSAPPVGNTVDPKRASYTNDIGDSELSAVWEDPNFEPSTPAFYYVRVLEIPTPRWTTHDAAARGTELPKGVPASIQERAYTSPIWYQP